MEKGRPCPNTSAGEVLSDSESEVPLLRGLTAHCPRRNKPQEPSCAAAEGHTSPASNLQGLPSLLEHDTLAVGKGSKLWRIHYY